MQLRSLRWREWLGRLRRARKPRITLLIAVVLLGGVAAALPLRDQPAAASVHQSSKTPKPGATATPRRTPRPTPTPRPTHTPTPTPTATPSPTPTPAPTPPPPPPPTPGPPGTGTVVVYDTNPGAVPDPWYAVLAGTQVIPVEHAFDIGYARFAMTGSVNIEVATAQPITSFSISPRSYGITGTAAGTTLAFTLAGPANIIVTINGLEKLFVFADPIEVNPPAANGPGIVNLSSYVSDSSGATLQTKQIQNAIDATSALGGGAGGVLYVPDGTYLTGTILLRSNVAMYLQSGARLQGSAHSGDYSGNALIATAGGSNAKVFGRGIIDQNGTAIRAGGGSKKRIIEPLGGSNLEFDDVLLRDSSAWTVHINGVAGVTVNNLKIVNNQLVTNLDGIDPDSSTNVTITGAFLYTSDDCFAVKTTGNQGFNGPTSGVLIQNSVCWTQKSALKIGTETHANISNVTFSGNNVVHADRAMSIYLNDGGNLQSLTYANDFSEAIGGNVKQMLIDFEVSSGLATGISVSNYVAYGYSPNNSLVSAQGGSPFNVAFTNLVIAGVQCLDAATAHITLSNATATFSP
jgi:hypothetical protein